MLRSLLPSILTSLGSFAILLAVTMTLYEWQINEIVTDFPKTYEVHVLPSPWTARFGDSLNDNFFVSSEKIYVSKNGMSCSPDDLNFVVKRSQKDEAVEHLPINFSDKYGRWLDICAMMLLYLSIGYIWWYIIFYEHRSIFLAVVFTVIAVGFGVELTQIVRPLLPRTVPWEYLGSLDCYHGTVTFSAKLAKINYETVFVFLAGICAEVGAVGIMVRQVVKAIMQRKESSKSAVG